MTMHSLLRRRPGAAATAALVLAAACSGGDGPTPSQSNPVPVMSFITPETVERGASQATVTVTGQSFVAQSVVRLNGAPRPTEFVSATELRATLSAADLAVPSAGQVTVFTPAPGGGTSAPADLLVANPAPQVTALSPSSVEVTGAAVVVTVTGTGFVPESKVMHFGGLRPTTWVSSTELRVTMAPGDLGIPGAALLMVVSPPPGGGASLPKELAIVNPAPQIVSLSPAFVLTGDPTEVTVTGAGFTGQTSLRVNGELRPPTILSFTQLRVPLGAGDLGSSGTLELRLDNPGPGGGSAATTLEVRAPVPVVTSLLDSMVMAGTEGFTIYVNGTGFGYNSVVRLDGAARPTELQSMTQLRATLSADDLDAPGRFDVTVATPAPGGGVSNAVGFRVASPVPAITELSPGSASTGLPGITVTVRGTGFVPGSAVLAEGSPRATTYVSGTELRAALTQADLAPAGDLRLRVRNPAPGGGDSEEAGFGLWAPVPVVTSLAPAYTADRQPQLTLVVNGTGFASNSIVRFDLSERPTQFVSTTKLEATLSEADLHRAGVYSVQVESRGPGGGLSQPVDFEVRAPAPTITSLDAAQTTAGQSSFALRVNGTGFRVGSLVRLDGVERTTSYLGPTLVEAMLYQDDLAAAKTFQVTVATAAPGGGVSNAAQFQVVAQPSPSSARSRP